jgi:hypothetical protein
MFELLTFITIAAVVAIKWDSLTVYFRSLGDNRGSSIMTKIYKMVKNANSEQLFRTFTEGNGAQIFTMDKIRIYRKNKVDGTSRKYFLIVNEKNIEYASERDVKRVFDYCLSKITPLVGNMNIADEMKKGNPLTVEELTEISSDYNEIVAEIDEDFFNENETK